MSVPQTRTALLSAIDKNFAKLQRYLEVIPPELTLSKTMEGHAKGTQISVCDLICYLLGWNNLVIKWINQGEKGQPVDFPESGYKWNQLGLLAQKFYQDYQHLDYGTLILNLQSANRKIVQMIKNRTDEALYGKAWYGKWTMGRMISFNTSSPYANACARLRKWAKENAVRLQ
ncbi:ClbS/DfsB family four-helix bundle protein [Erwinia sp. ACCC 02193]|uniref:ClbS/DfsB family four-helix bundle protein n=1 Tax=Erwinia aeris TaxID=3239803 RepID=A0ABV4EAP5_9GAMM